MQITLERSGGFTGIPLTIKVDTATLPPEQAQQLHQLVEAADFFNLPAAAPMPAQPDRFEYGVTVEEGDRKHMITVGEIAVPEALKSLISRLIHTTP